MQACKLACKTLCVAFLPTWHKSTRKQIQVKRGKTSKILEVTCPARTRLPVYGLALGSAQSPWANCNKAEASPA
eukprot:291337-Pelagomonas_calceolata.AAC.1